MSRLPHHLFVIAKPERRAGPKPGQSNRYAAVFGIACGLLGACSGGPVDAQFSVRYAPDFRGGARMVSVLGVLQDGVMSQQGWQASSAEVSRALNRSPCQSGFDDSFRAANVRAFTAIEEQARSTAGINNNAPRPEISASLFSVTARRTGVEVVMEYSGGSGDEAVKSFAQKLGSSLPSSRCVGWNWSAVTTTDELDDAGILIRRSLVPVQTQ